VTAPPVAPEPITPAPVAEAVSAPVVAPQAPLPAPTPAPLTPPNFDAAYLNNPPPVYPPLARRQGLSGKVVLRVYVSAAGSAEQVEIRTSSSHALLDQAARNAVLRWRFVPARQGDQPVAAWVLVPITFTLES
jgi:protein TonB